MIMYRVFVLICGWWRCVQDGGRG